METIPTTILANGKEMVLDAAPRLTVLVHQQGIRVDVPEFVEINGRNTLDCMEKMSQRAWVHISTGELFQYLFREVFPAEDGDVPIPATIEELNKGDFGVIHVAGMIVLACEAIFEGKYKIFLRTPEDHLHPKAERRIVPAMMKLRELLAVDENVQVIEAPKPETETPKPKRGRPKGSKNKPKDKS